MVLHIVVEMGGEGEVHAFKAKRNAEEKAADEGVYLGFSKMPKPPGKVFLVLGGDRGCTCEFVGAYKILKVAEKKATAVEKESASGLSYYAMEVLVED